MTRPAMYAGSVVCTNGDYVALLTRRVACSDRFKGSRWCHAPAVV